MPHFLVEISVVAAAEASDVLAHQAFLQRITDDQNLLLTAQLPDKPEKRIAILKAASIDEARSIYEEAPLVKKGVLEWTISNLKLTFGTAVRDD
jgi:uncharacterized protein YciI